VLLVGLEPEEESPIVFLRLRKGTRRGVTQVHSVAALRSRGLDKLGGTLHHAIPGDEAQALRLLDPSVTDALAGGVVLVGERMATAPGVLTEVLALAHRAGARIAWVPRRAGERGAVDAGALPTLLPGGRPVTDDAARVEVERVWRASVPTAAGRDLAAILAAAADEQRPLGGLLVGGVQLSDLPDPAATELALAHVGFVVSLELRHSAITDYADVVLPVAAAAEKAGRFVNWEGRRRPFDLTLTNTGQLSDGRVLHALADEMDIDLALPTEQAARDELTALGVTGVRLTHSAVSGSARSDRPASARSNSALTLATWHELIDAGLMSDGDENLAGTAKPLRAAISASTAQALNARDGSLVTVSTGHGALIAPVLVTESVLDGVVWLPTNHRDGSVRATLRAVHGDPVTVTVGGMS
jgi:NADH-quinone oxidoreductase subunit G